MRRLSHLIFPDSGTSGMENNFSVHEFSLESLSYSPEFAKLEKIQRKLRSDEKQLLAIISCENHDSEMTTTIANDVFNRYPSISMEKESIGEKAKKLLSQIAEWFANLARRMSDFISKKWKQLVNFLDKYVFFFKKKVKDIEKDSKNHDSSKNDVDEKLHVFYFKIKNASVEHFHTYDHPRDFFQDLMNFFENEIAYMTEFAEEFRVFAKEVDDSYHGQRDNTRSLAAFKSEMDTKYDKSDNGESPVRGMDWFRDPMQHKQMTYTEYATIFEERKTRFEETNSVIDALNKRIPEFVRSIQSISGQIKNIYEEHLQLITKLRFDNTFYGYFMEMRNRASDLESSLNKTLTYISQYTQWVTAELNHYHDYIKPNQENSN